MKKLFALTMILGFIWALPASAWQDPCSATQYTYEWGDYALGSWAEVSSAFSPAPKCQGIVMFCAPGGLCYPMDYVGYKDVLMIEGVPCTVSDNGDLICKIITQEVLRFDKNED